MKASVSSSNAGVQRESAKSSAASSHRISAIKAASAEVASPVKPGVRNVTSEGSVKIHFKGVAGLSNVEASIKCNACYLFSASVTLFKNVLIILKIFR